MTPVGIPLRAAVATVAFGLAGLAGLVFAPSPWALRAPNAAFYAVLVLNTFYSVRYFDALGPQDRDERIIDGILAINYLLLAAAIGTPWAFAILSGSLFALGIAKYVLLFPIMGRHPSLLRKIRMNGLGLLLCAATLAGVLFLDPMWSAWFQAIVFALANIYLLAINPMYAEPMSHSRPS